MKKMIKPLVVTGAIAILLAGCSNEKDVTPGDKDTKNAPVSSTAKITDSLYKLKDSEVLVEVNGEKLTVGEVKKKAFENTLVSEINQFTDRILLIEKYGPTDEELEKELEKIKETQSTPVGNEEGSTPPVGNIIDKETLRHNMAYEKAIKDGVEITKEDLLKIKKEYFPNEERTYAEMEEELRRVAPYYMGNNVYELTAELKKEAKINYVNKELQKQFEEMNATIVPTDNEVDETTEDKKE